MSASHKKKTKKNSDLKNTLCDIVKKISAFSETDKKLEELANFCAGERRVRSETRR